MDRKFYSDSAEAGAVSICIHALCLHNIHTNIVALPFCKSEQRSEKPKPKGYPLEPKTLGDHIRKHRMDLKLFQHQVAEQLGVDKSTIHNWERNFNTPDTRLVPRIIEFLGYSPFPQSV